MSNALYLFCLARAGLIPSLEGRGINGDEVLLKKDFSDVAAIACEVREDEFAGSSAEQRLQNLEWVAPRAVRHEQVIEEVMKFSPVLPAPFGSLFSSSASVERLIESNLGAINRFLDHVSEREEWSVKAYLSRPKALDEIVAAKMKDSSEILSTLTTGMRYFKERQLQAEAEKELGNWIKETCSIVAQELISCSTDSRQRKIVPLHKEEGDRQQVVNWAFLVADSLVGDFLNRIESANARFNARGLFFESSGPWPPYSFSPPLSLEQET